MIVNDDPSVTGNAKFSGLMVDVLQAVSKLAGFTYDISVVPDGNWDGTRMDGDYEIQVGLLGEVFYKVKLQYNSVSPV